MQEQKVCNKCGKILDTWDIQEDFTLERALGFGTKHDGETLKLRLCCKCIEDLINGCKVNPLSE